VVSWPHLVAVQELGLVFWQVHVAGRSSCGFVVLWLSITPVAGCVFSDALLVSCGQTALLKAEVCVGVMRSSCSCALFLSRLAFFAPVYGGCSAPLMAGAQSCVAVLAAQVVPRLDNVVQCCYVA